MGLEFNTHVSQETTSFPRSGQQQVDGGMHVRQVTVFSNNRPVDVEDGTIGNTKYFPFTITVDAEVFTNAGEILELGKQYKITVEEVV